MHEWRGDPTARPFPCLIFGAPTEEGCVKDLQFFIGVPIPFVGFLFVESLFECVTLRDFHFNFTISFSKN